MTDGHLCTRWFERGLGCPFDGAEGAAWHTFSYNPDESFHFDEYPPEDKAPEVKGKGRPSPYTPDESFHFDEYEREDDRSQGSGRSPDEPFDYDEWLENNGLRTPSIAFTEMGYEVYGSLLLQQQKILGMTPKPSFAPALNVLPFTSTGAYLEIVEASEVALSLRTAKATTAKDSVRTGMSSTQRSYTAAEIASVIIWATSIAVAVGITRAQQTPAGFAATMAVRVVPAEVLAFVANLGKTSPGIWGETVLLAKLSTSWLYANREMAPLPDKYVRNVYNQNAWADPGLG